MASYNPPNPYVPGAFNPTQFITPSDNITTKYLDENYLRFPFAQGVENFVSINNQGSLNQGGLADFSSNTTPAIFNLPPTITNPIANTATTPANAVATIGYVLANEQGGGDLLPLNNLWSGVNNFNPTPNQTYGSVLNTGITITDNQFPPGGQGDNDIISYTPTGAQGLCLYSSSTNNITGQFPQIQLYPDGTETKLSASATNGTIVLAAQGTGGAIQLNANTGVKIGTQPILTFSTFGNLTGSAGGIKSSVNLTAPSFVISDGVDDNYQLYSQNSGSFGFVIANTSGTGLGTLTISNGSSIATTLTASTSGLTSTTPLILPAQTTYDSGATYGNVASTQEFVQKALASQGSGDVTLGGNNAFTGTNTFSGGCASLIVQPFPSPSSTQFTTFNYVNNLQSTASTLTFFLGIGFGGNPTYFTIPTLIIGGKLVQIVNYTINDTADQSSSNIISWNILNSNLTGQQNLSVSVYIASTNQVYTCPITYWVYSGGNMSAQATCPINLFGLGSIAITFNGYLTIS